MKNRSRAIQRQAFICNSKQFLLPIPTIDLRHQMICRQVRTKMKLYFRYFLIAFVDSIFHSARARVTKNRFLWRLHNQQGTQTESMRWRLPLQMYSSTTMESQSHAEGDTLYRARTALHYLPMRISIFHAASARAET